MLMVQTAWSVKPPLARTVATSRSARPRMLPFESLDGEVHHPPVTGLEIFVPERYRAAATAELDGRRPDPRVRTDHGIGGQGAGCHGRARDDPANCQRANRDRRGHSAASHLTSPSLFSHSLS
jgi:hypothetical protein